MESFSIAPPGGGSRSRNSDDPLLGHCDAGAVAVGVRFHHWGLGFRQCSFRPITRASRDGIVNAFGCLPLLWHALFPSSFRLQVNQTAQKPPSEFLLTASGIQHRVPRRTVSSHTAQAWVNAPVGIRGCPIGLGANLDVTSAGPATELPTVVAAAPATTIAVAPTDLPCCLRRLTESL